MCIYKFRSSNNHVDDGLLEFKDKSNFEKIIGSLKQLFEVKIADSGIFLGMEIVCKHDSSILIHQRNYAEKIVKRFRMTDANEVAVPTDPHQNLSMFKEKPENNTTLKSPYREAIGSLLFLAKVSRPDIMYAVINASQFMQSPGKAHWNNVKRIIKYIKGTLGYGLEFKKNNDLSRMKVYSDADYAGDLRDRKSTTGFLLQIGEGTIVWGTRKQKTVALSTTESEYIAGCEAVKEIIWFTGLMKELHQENTEIPVLYMDNQSALKLVKNPEFHSRTKHIDIKHHFIRERFEKGEFNVMYIETKKQKADILTKPINKKDFEYLRELIGVKLIS